jgi:uncharacterized membrane protein required for colicin V production
MKMEDIGIGWIDLMIATVVVVGIIRGRKRGMSEELLDVLKWLLILATGSFCYGPLGVYLSSSTMFSHLAAYVASYLAIIIFFNLIFSFIRRKIGGKVIGSDVFGNAEYYLGMGAGGIRYACMTLVVMALLHARYYSPADVQAELKSQLDSYGSDFFPSVYKMQRAVFEKSFAGRATQNYLPTLLIKSTPPEEKGLGNARIIKAREREVYEVLEK